jgi:predicted ArsR family transcriptional regulator
MKRLKPTFPEGWMTAQDLVEPCGLGVDSKTIKRYLQPLCEEGLVQFREGSNSKKGQTPNTYRISEGNLVL